MSQQDAVQRFAEEARRFQQWARYEVTQGEAAAREALLRIMRLYAAALALPAPWSEELDLEAADRVDDAEWREVFEAAGRLPLDHYAEQFDPLNVPGEEAVVGSVADDIADIYRDVVTGLREYEAGRRAEGIWEWGFNFVRHWGGHATGAIRALHAWLAANAPNQLSEGAPADKPSRSAREPG